jgi:hypothetical protein
LAVRLEDVAARLAAQKVARSAVSVIAGITRERTTLTEALRAITLPEEDCRALPDKMRDLGCRLFDFSVELSEDPDCDVEILDKIAEMEEQVQRALVAFDGTSGEKGNVVEPSAQIKSFHHFKFTVVTYSGAQRTTAATVRLAGSADTDCGS